MKEQLNGIRSKAEAEIANIKTIPDLENVRVKYLGKKGELTSVLRGMGSLAPEERPVIGQLANEIRNFLENRIAEVKKNLQTKRGN